MVMNRELNASVIQELRSGIRGSVRCDTKDLGLYATDASMYQIQPLAVVEPLDADDALAAVRICCRHEVPLLPRGGGTSLTGQSVNRAVVLDMSHHCNRVLEFNAEERWVRVEPGIVRDELNAWLKPRGLYFAPDPATSNRACVGGMIGNNAAGMRSLKYGMTIDHVKELAVALSNGESVVLGGEDISVTAQRLRNGLEQIIQENHDEIVARYPKVARRAGGYALDAFTEAKPWNTAAIFSGSEGSLGCVLEAKLNLVPLPRHTALCLAHFDSLGKCLRAVRGIVEQGASAVELIDGLILRQARKHPMTASTCDVIEGEPEAILIIEAMDDDPAVVRETLARIQAVLKSEGSAYHMPLMRDPEDIRKVWLMRSSALGLMTTVKGTRKPTPYIEDSAVGLDVLPEYVESVLDICKEHGQPVSLFAHAGAGLLHIRPLHDLHKPEEIEQLKLIQEKVFQQVCRFKGSWSGEHGDGIVRGGFNRRFFGEQIYNAFKDVKDLFDPVGLMNPGKKVDIPPNDQNLRFGEEYRFDPVQSIFRFEEEEGLQSAVEQCTGVGACRKALDGVMCPSYMATRDEEHSTRGRANALRLALSGQLGSEGMADQAVMEVFDLCLSCKGCKSECPNKVDVGKMKAEVLYHYYLRHPRPLRSRMFSNPAGLGRLSSGTLASIANAVLATAPMKGMLEAVLGIDKRRNLPAYARRRFSTLYKQWRTLSPAPTEGEEILLFNDAYLEHHEPELGLAVVRMLEVAGFRVELSVPLDSQRPALSQGMLAVARKRGERVMRTLEPYAVRGMRIAVLEPSCASALSQDLPDLIEDRELAGRVAPAVVGIETLLFEALSERGDDLPWNGSAKGVEILLHTHCHQKAVDGGAAVAGLLKLIPGVDVKESGAGCCGMAGGFGYEKKHYDISVKVAEDRLVPAINATGQTALLAASGFSCRHQISDLSKRKAFHPVALLARFMNLD